MDMKFIAAFSVMIFVLSSLSYAATVDTAIVTTDITSVDFLVAKSAAEKSGMPIFVAENGQISDELKSELVQIEIKNVIFVGGPAVIKPESEDALKDYTIIRLWGMERTGTAVETAKYFWQEGSTCAVLVDDTKNSDYDVKIQTQAAALAANLKCPLIPIPKGQIPAEVLVVFGDLGVKDLYLVGENFSGIRQNLSGLNIKEFSGNIDDISKSTDNEIINKTAKEGKSLKIVIVAAPNFKFIHGIGAEPSENSVVKFVSNVSEVANISTLIKEKGITDVRVVGSPSLAQQIAAELQKQNITVKQITGTVNSINRQILGDTITRWEEKRNENNRIRLELKESIKIKLTDRLDEIKKEIAEEKITIEDLRLQGASSDKLDIINASIADANNRISEIQNFLDTNNITGASDLMIKIKNKIREEKFNFRLDIKLDVGEEIRHEEEKEADIDVDSTNRLNGIEQRFAELRRKCGDISILQSIVSKAKSLRATAIEEINSKNFTAAGKTFVELRSLRIEAEILKKICEKKGKLENQEDFTKAAGMPFVEIKNPKNGETTGSTIKVDVNVQNFKLISEETGSLEVQGHVHVWIDDAIEQEGPMKSFVFQNLSAGQHRIRAELMKVGHTQLNTRVFGEINITVVPTVGSVGTEGKSLTSNNYTIEAAT